MLVVRHGASGFERQLERGESIELGRGLLPVSDKRVSCVRAAASPPHGLSHPWPSPAPERPRFASGSPGSSGRAQVRIEALSSGGLGVTNIGSNAIGLVRGSDGAPMAASAPASTGAHLAGGGACSASLDGVTVLRKGERQDLYSAGELSATVYLAQNMHESSAGDRIPAGACSGQSDLTPLAWLHPVWVGVAGVSRAARGHSVVSSGGGGGGSRSASGDRGVRRAGHGNGEWVSAGVAAGGSGSMPAVCAAGQSVGQVAGKAVPGTSLGLGRPCAPPPAVSAGRAGASASPGGGGGAGAVSSESAGHVPGGAMQGGGGGARQGGSRTWLFLDDSEGESGAEGDTWPSGSHGGVGQPWSQGDLAHVPSTAA
eukprot:scaffold4091_cov100-Isochrysis_galbana.AAC.1